jgi:hypothetical protein
MRRIPHPPASEPRPAKVNGMMMSKLSADELREVIRKYPKRIPNNAPMRRDAINESLPDRLTTWVSPPFRPWIKAMR